MRALVWCSFAATAAVCAGLLAQACSGATPFVSEPSSAQGARASGAERSDGSTSLPAGVRAPLNVPPTPTRKVAEGDKPVSAPSPFPELDYTRDISPELDLARFAPLLSTRELSAASAACEREDYSRCGDEIEAALPRRALTAIEEPRWHLLLGSVRERAGDPTGALAAYRQSAEVAWPLTDFALLGMGRALIALGRQREAVDQLGRIGQGSTYPAAQGLMAESSCAALQTERCVNQLRSLTTHPAKPPGWAREGFRLMGVLVDGLAAPLRQDLDTDQKKLALTYLRELMTLAPNTSAARGGDEMEARLLASFSQSDRAALERPSTEQQLARLRALVGAGRRADSERAAEQLLDSLGSAAPARVACEVNYLWGKALSGRANRARGIRKLERVIENCKDPDRRAWSLYLAGKYSFRIDEYADADRFFAKLEREAPRHRLADDARLYRARAQREMGVEARFSELLRTMPDDYPNGDMMLDGIFQLALRSLERGDWKGAEPILRRAAALATPRDDDRGPEWAGRERYFHARALIETGEVERGLAALQSLIEDRPLSYYMLHAYSQLRAIDAQRADQVVRAAVEAGAKQAFEIHHRPEFEQPGFVRVLELMRQSELEAARQEIKLLRFGRRAPPAVLWGIAVLWSQAGSPLYSHSIPRWQLTDWKSKWPAGDWRHAWRLAYPRPYAEAVKRNASALGLEPQLVYAIMREESAFNPGAVSGASAYGLMQVIPPTARHFAREAGLRYDKGSLVVPDVSIAIGTRVLASYGSRFPQDPLLAIPGYNAGPGRPRQWIQEWPRVPFDVWVELIPYRETRRYTKRVLGSRAAYAYLYYEKSPEAALTLPTKLHGSGG